MIWITMAYEHSNITIRNLPLTDLPKMTVVKSDKECSCNAYLELPDEFNDPLALYFKTSHTKIKMYLEGELIYSFGFQENSIPFLKSPGTSWHVVTLPKLSGNKTLSVDFQTPYNTFSGVVPNIQYGTEGDCIAEYQNSSIYSLFSILLILLSGFSTILIYFFTRIKKNVITKAFLYISSFALFVSIWMIVQSGSMQLYVGYPQVMYFFDLISLILFPIPINLYIYYMSLTDKKDALKYFSWAYLVVLALNLVLQVTSLVDMFQLVPLTHALMALNIVYVIYLIIFEMRRGKNIDLKNFLIPLIVIMIGGTVEMAFYYVNGMRSTSVALGYSVVIFLIILIANSIKRYYNSVMDLRETEYYEKLARIDLLTDLSNRNRYEEVLLSHKPEEHMTAVLFDLNCLKYINDHYGHSVGDKAIISCAECIKQSFSHKGECFRIGGDEFAVLIKAEEKLEKECQEFEKLVKASEQKLDFPFSVAYGTARFKLEIDRSIYDTVRRADLSMYNMKEEQKRQLML